MKKERDKKWKLIIFNVYLYKWVLEKCLQEKQDLPNGRIGCFVHKYRRLTGDKYELRKNGGKSDVAWYGRSPKSPKSYQNGSRVTADSGNEARGFNILSKQL